MLYFPRLIILSFFMMHASPLSVLKRRSKSLFGVGLIVAILALIFSLLLPLEYRADAQLLVVSKTRYGVDPYTAVKSAERVGENLEKIVKTDVFYNQVFAQPNYQLDANDFRGLTDRERRKKWEKTMHASVAFGTGVLNVSAYHTDPAQAKAYAAAAMDALVQNGWEFVGGDVTLKVINRPVVTSIPVRPNLVTNAIAGFLVGVLFAAVRALRKKHRYFS